MNPNVSSLIAAVFYIVWIIVGIVFLAGHIN